MRVVLLYPCTMFEVRSAPHLPFGRYGARCVSALMGLVTLAFDLLTLNWCASRIYGGEPSFQIWAR